MTTTRIMDMMGATIAVPETQRAITTNTNPLMVPINRKNDLQLSIIFRIILVKNASYSFIIT
jgi:hypothetical protein